MKDPGTLPKRLPLGIAKIIDKRRRTKIDRARMISTNAELQKHILHTTELYNLQAERHRLQTMLRPDVNYVPALARPVHQAALDQLTRQSERLEERLQAPGPDIPAPSNGNDRIFRRLRRVG